MKLLYCGDLQVGYVTYASLLQGCVDTKALAEGKWIHTHMIKSGLEPNVFVENNLINMYAKCGSFNDVCQVFNKMYEWNVISWNTMITGYVKQGAIEFVCQMFDKIPEQDLVSWNSIIAGYANTGDGEKTLGYFVQMLRVGMRLDRITFTNALGVCVGIEDFIAFYLF